MAKSIAVQLIGVHQSLSLQESNQAVTSFRQSERALSYFKFGHQDRVVVHKQTIDHMSSEEARSFSEGLVRALGAKPWRWKYAKNQHRSYWARVALIADYARSKSFIQNRIAASEGSVLVG